MTYRLKKFIERIFLFFVSTCGNLSILESQWIPETLESGILQIPILGFTGCCAFGQLITGIFKIEDFWAGEVA
jgi:hypothetical protein